MSSASVTPERIETTYKELDKDALSGGYYLNPDAEFTRMLVEGLLVNEDRYGYPSCPCRKASGKKEEDLDIICPCDYRDPDLGDFGACYCALYVSRDIYEGRAKARPIPERRPPEGRQKDQIPQPSPSGNGLQAGNLKYPIWRCKVCGYICARDNPPEICPICKAKKDRFERFL